MKRTTPIQALLALFVTVAVLFTQTVLTAAPEWAQAGAAKNCGCGLKHCCLQQADKDSQPVPSAPLRTTQETQLQVVLVLVAQLLDQPALTEVQLPPAGYFTPRATVMPLYQRNCSYLI